MSKDTIIAQIEHVLRIHPDDSATLTYRWQPADKPTQEKTIEYPPGRWLDLARMLIVQGHADAKESRLKQQQEAPPIKTGIHVVTGIENGIMKAGVRVEVPHGCPVCAANTLLTMFFSADEWGRLIQDAHKAEQLARDANDVTRN